MTKPRLLVVEDEAALIAVLEPVLTAAGYQVESCGSGVEAVSMAAASPPDVVLLDLGLPDLDGKEVLAQIRAWSELPVVVISARHQEAEKIAALDGGADDYVDKPFDMGELLARLRASLRRAQRSRRRPTVVENGYLSINLSLRSVTLDGDPVRLSPKEYDLLRALAESPGQVVTHKRLLAAGWGDAATDTQYLRVYVGLLRQKIEEDPSDPTIILTEPGVGYRLVAEEADSGGE